jgi:GNAT superfamily N-acetyltransferase
VPYEVREVGAEETGRAAGALLELRPGFGSAEELAARVDALRASGYRVVGSFEPGEADAAAVAGFRVGESLAWGRYLYVDDLVTRAGFRGRGHADAVMAWVVDEARRLGCEQLHLDSGVGPDRADAHRFYFRHGMRIVSFHFARGTSTGPSRGARP